MKFSPILALLATAGCLTYNQTTPAYWETHQQSAQDQWNSQGDQWDTVEGSTENVVGMDGNFQGKPVDRKRPEPKYLYLGDSKQPTQAPANMSSRIRILEARIEALERIVATLRGGAALPAVRVKPATNQRKIIANLYRVQSDGKLAWITKGTKAGVASGQVLSILRAGKTIGTARVLRVWDDSAELEIQNANTVVKEGDSLLPR